MEYRQLPHGKEQISVLGLGMGGIGKAPVDEIEAIIRKAIAHGINFFDMCTANSKSSPCLTLEVSALWIVISLCSGKVIKISDVTA